MPTSQRRRGRHQATTAQATRSTAQALLLLHLWTRPLASQYRLLLLLRHALEARRNVVSLAHACCWEKEDILLELPTWRIYFLLRSSGSGLLSPIARLFLHLPCRHVALSFFHHQAALCFSHLLLSHTLLSSAVLLLFNCYHPPSSWFTVPVRIQQAGHLYIHILLCHFHPQPSSCLFSPVHSYYLKFILLPSCTLSPTQFWKTHHLASSTSVTTGVSLALTLTSHWSDHWKWNCVCWLHHSCDRNKNGGSNSECPETDLVCSVAADFAVDYCVAGSGCCGVGSGDCCWPPCCGCGSCSGNLKRAMEAFNESEAVHQTCLPPKCTSVVWVV